MLIWTGLQADRRPPIRHGRYARNCPGRLGAVGGFFRAVGPRPVAKIRYPVSRRGVATPRAQRGPAAAGAPCGGGRGRPGPMEHSMSEPTVDHVRRIIEQAFRAAYALVLFAKKPGS